MTIAACYLSSEGVVFGADSTTTIYVPGGGQSPGTEHHYNFAQKIFQIGEDSTLGMTMWGLGGFPNISYRTLIAQFADALVGRGARSMAEVATLWSQFFWSAYSQELADVLQRAQDLSSKPQRTPIEEGELIFLQKRNSGGFCIGGYLMNDRRPAAFQIRYDPCLTSPAVEPLETGQVRFWGDPHLIQRVLFGIDESLFWAILRSGKWMGTDEELLKLVADHCLKHPFQLPIREAIDWIHASIYTTIKAMKFSHLPPICGGPIEIAVITTDRKFRWVRHKRFDAAIGEEVLPDAYRFR